MAKKFKQLSKTPPMTKKKVETIRAASEPQAKRKKFIVENDDHEFEKTLKARKEKVVIKKKEEEEEEEDVESDVDSADEDIDDEDDIDEEDSDDDELGSDDDDDDDEGDDDDEEEEEEEEEDEKKEEVKIQKGKKGEKLNGKVDTQKPKKQAGEKKGKDGKSEKDGEKKKKKQEDIPHPSKFLKDSDPEIKEANISLEERNERSLFVKLLPRDMTETELQQLHPNIHRVRFIKKKRALPRARRSAFVEFKNEEVLEQSLAKFKEVLAKKCKDAVVDYAGQKSSFMQMRKEKIAVYTPLKLFVTGFDKNTTYGDIKKMFPNASTIVGEFKGEAANSPKESRTLTDDQCVVCFKSEKECKEAFSFKLTTKSGSKVLIQYSRATKRQVKNTLKKIKRKARKLKGKGGAKETEAKKAVDGQKTTVKGEQKTPEKGGKKQQNVAKSPKVSTPKASPGAANKSAKKPKLDASASKKTPSPQAAAQKRKAPMDIKNKAKKSKN